MLVRHFSGVPLEKVSAHPGTKPNANILGVRRELELSKVAGSSKDETTDLWAQLLIDDIHAPVGHDRKVTEGARGRYHAMPEAINERHEGLRWRQLLIIFHGPLFKSRLGLAAHIESRIDVILPPNRLNVKLPTSISLDRSVLRAIRRRSANHPGTVRSRSLVVHPPS